MTDLQKLTENLTVLYVEDDEEVIKKMVEMFERLFKKVVIADTFAIWAIQGFDVATTLNLFEAWATSLSYTFQLYFDFSGYTDMAIGAALLFNIKLPINFNSPYKAVSIQDFWRRWHISLSSWFRDYMFAPLYIYFQNPQTHFYIIHTKKLLKVVHNYMNNNKMEN